MCMWRVRVCARACACSGAVFSLGLLSFATPAMGVVLTRAEVVRGLEPLSDLHVTGVRVVFEEFEELCPTPALWERAFAELLGCFGDDEASARSTMSTAGVQVAMTKWCCRC